MSRKKTHKIDLFLFTKNINLLADDINDRYAFADAIGVSYESIRRWCNGENLPDGQQLLAIREKFGVSIDWLLAGSEPIPVRIAPGITEEPAPYGDPQRCCPFCGGMTEEMKKLCKTLKEIVDSKHPVIVPALLSNLEAFKYSVDKEQKQDEDIDKLKREVRHLKTLMSSDLLTGTGRAAGAGMRKRKM